MSDSPASEHMVVPASLFIHCIYIYIYTTTPGNFCNPLKGVFARMVHLFTASACRVLNYRYIRWTSVLSSYLFIYFYLFINHLQQNI